MLRFGDWVKNLARILSTIDNLARYLKHFLGVWHFLWSLCTLKGSSTIYLSRGATHLCLNLPLPAISNWRACVLAWLFHRRGKSKSKLIYSPAGENTVNQSDVKKAREKESKPRLVWQFLVSLMIGWAWRQSRIWSSSFWVFTKKAPNMLLNIVSSRWRPTASQLKK